MASLGAIRSGRSFKSAFGVRGKSVPRVPAALTSRESSVKGRPSGDAHDGSLPAFADDDEDGRNRRPPPRVLQNHENDPLIPPSVPTVLPRAGRGAGPHDDAGAKRERGEGVLPWA